MCRFLLVAAAAFGLSLTASAASALCLASPEVGNWRNSDSATRGITRASVSFDCNDVSLNGHLPSTPPFHIRLWGACSPSDCAWNEVPARRLDNGWIYGNLDQGFARREVWAKMVGGQLRVHIRTDFTDPSRTDYNMDNYFVPG